MAEIEIKDDELDDNDGSEHAAAVSEGAAEAHEEQAERHAESAAESSSAAVSAAGVAAESAEVAAVSAETASEAAAESEAALAAILAAVNEQTTVISSLVEELRTQHSKPEPEVQDKPVKKTPDRPPTPSKRSFRDSYFGKRS